MSWNIRWQIPFARQRTGEIYTINIYEKDYTGTPTKLLGGPKPFETQEENDEDLFLPIRSQSGYIRIEDTSGGSLMEEMIPANNVERMVKLMKGSEVKWQGFLCARAYSQPWTNRNRLLEFPVKSVLGALEDLRFTSNNMGIEMFLYQVFQGITELTNPSLPFANVVGINDHDGNPFSFLVDISVFTNVFFSKDTIRNEGESVYEYVGQSYFDIFNDLLSVFGLIAREEGDTLFFSQYDHPGTVLKKTTAGWDSVFGQIIMPEGWGISDMEESDLLDSAEFVGKENSAGYMQGGSVAIVDLQLSTQDNSIEFPPVAETADEPKIVDLEHGECLFVQPHRPVNTSLVQYAYYEYSPYNYIGESDYDTMVQKTIFNGYTPNPYPFGEKYDSSQGVYDSEHMYTGAFPVRFNTRANDMDLVELKDGLYFNAHNRNVLRGENYEAKRAIYRQTSGISFNMNDGYLCFTSSCLNVIKRHSSSGFFAEPQSSQLELRIYVRISIGGKLWWDDDKEEWVDEETKFVILLKNGSVKTNKTTDIMVDASNGYFIPVSGEKGNITLEILDYAVTYDLKDELNEYLCYTHILYDFAITYYPKENMVSSTRDENIYRQVIQTRGFSEEKRIDLNFGTMNNNDDNPCFLRKDSNYLQSFDFRTSSGKISLRPEIRLVNRLADYYSQTRRTFTAVIDDNVNLAGRVFVYNGRRYMAVDSGHDWRAGEIEVMFIEV